MIVQVPTVTITTPAGTLDSKRVVFTSVQLRSSVFNKGGATIELYEKPINGEYLSIFDLAGQWTINLSGSEVWTGICYVESIHSDRLVNWMHRSITLTDQTEAWNVLLKDKVFPTQESSTYTVGNLIADLVNGAVAASGVTTDIVVDNSTTLISLLNQKQYSVRSSTYLAELNKVLSWMGYKVYADPYKGKISVIDPNTTPTQGTTNISFRSPELISPSFDIAYGDIATTVVTGDDISGNAVAYGHLGNPANDTNYNLRKLAKVAFITTYGVKDEKLASVATSVYNLSRQGSQKLVIKFAGYLGQSLLWTALEWVDANGGKGNYKVSDYTIDISPQGVFTTLQAIL